MSHITYYYNSITLELLYIIPADHYIYMNTSILRDHRGWRGLADDYSKKIFAFSTNCSIICAMVCRSSVMANPTLKGAMGNETRLVV